MESNLCDSFHYAHNRGLFGYLLTQIQTFRCGEIILQLNGEGNKLDEESKVINENIDKYNRQISSYKREQLKYLLDSIFRINYCVLSLHNIILAYFKDLFNFFRF